MKAYTVLLTNGNQSILIPPNQVSENLASIPLVGANLSGYGDVIATAQLRMLENFANSTSPPNPLVGQLWYDEGTDTVKVYDGTEWSGVGEEAPSQLNDLSDVTITDPQAGEVLEYDFGLAQWVNRPLTLSFTDLSDTPSFLQPNHFLRVNSQGTAIVQDPRVDADRIEGQLTIDQIPLEELCQWLKENCAR